MHLNQPLKARKFLLLATTLFKQYISINQVCEAVKNELIQMGILPLENSIAGTFFDVLDLIEKDRLQIVGEFEHEEKQCLVVFPGSEMSDITEIESHPYAYLQCKQFLSTSGRKIIHSIDTASSCQTISHQKLKHVAAIASERAAKLYHLEILKELDVVSVTRYILVQKLAIIPERHLSPRTSLKVVIKNEKGAMMKVCTAFSLRDIKYSNLT
jgi:prephenate dehydratase